MVSNLEAIKKSFFRTTKCVEKLIGALEVVKLLVQIKGKPLPCDEAMSSILDALKRGLAIKDDHTTGYIPLYEEVKS